MTAGPRQSGPLDPAVCAAAPVDWAAPYATMFPDTTPLLFVRIVARRNFAGFPFWVSAAPEVCERLAAHARAYAETQGFGPGLALASLGSPLIGVLRERMILPERPASFPGKRDFKMLFQGAARGEFALFGETEHWTHVRTIFPAASSGSMGSMGSMGAPVSPHPSDASERSSDPSFLRTKLLPELLQSVALFARDNRNDEAPRAPGTSERSGKPVFSHSATWGFLTSNPAQAGTGLQYEAGLHLPALSSLHRITQTRQALAAMGFELQPLSLREPGSAEAGFFRLLSCGSLNLSEEESCRRFADTLAHVLATEDRAWIRWREQDATVLHDRMHRSLALLQDARRMDYPELQLLTSFVRSGIRADIFPTVLLPQLETLRIQGQPFHLHALKPQTSEEVQEMGVSVADLIGLPDPTSSPVKPSGLTVEGENGARAALARQLLSTP